MSKKSTDSTRPSAYISLSPGNEAMIPLMALRCCYVVRIFSISLLTRNIKKQGAYFRLREGLGRDFVENNHEKTK